MDGLEMIPDYHSTELTQVKLDYTPYPRGKNVVVSKTGFKSTNYSKRTLKNINANP